MSDNLPKLIGLDLGVVLLSDVSPMRRRRDWGGWRLNRRYRVLTLPKHLYEVDLDRCRTPGQVLDWIAQVGAKYWATDAILAGLVRALDDVLDLQAHLCSGGASSQRLDRTAVRELVREAPPARRRTKVATTTLDGGPRP